MEVNQGLRKSRTQGRRRDDGRENMKKILFIAPSPLYLEKGSSLRMYSILEKLSKHYKIDLVTYSLGRNFKLKNVNIHRTPMWFKPELSIGKPTKSKIFLDLLMWLKVIKLSCINKYDIIHCEDFEGIGIGYFIGWLNYKSKYIYDLHNRILDNIHLNSKPKKIKDNFLKILEKIFTNKSDKIILNWGKYLQDDFFKDRNKFLYYDLIELSIERINLPAKRYLIYSGNFEKYQGLGDFIPIFLSFKTDIKLILVGEPSEEIKKLIKKNKAENRIILMGRLSVKKTNYLIKNSLAGILPRRHGSCMKAIHYFLWGKYVIAKNTPSNRELIHNNYNGFLYKTDEELGNILEKILSAKRSNFKKLNKGILETRKNIFNIWNDKKFIKKYKK